MRVRVKVEKKIVETQALHKYTFILVTMENGFNLLVLLDISSRRGNTKAG